MDQEGGSGAEHRAKDTLRYNRPRNKGRISVQYSAVIRNKQDKANKYRPKGVYYIVNDRGGTEFNAVLRSL